jgi:Flp pilus assembly protein TadD
VLDTLGSILVASGKPGEALPYLREAHSRASREPSVRYHLALALAELGRAAEAEALLRELVAEGAEFDHAEAAASLLRRIQGS